MRALSVLTAYTEREYVGLECLWLEAMSALLLVIGMLNSCCEAKKLSESCAGIIGSIVLASLGVAAAVVIRLPCVPLHPEIAVEAAVDEMGSGMVPPDLLSDLLLTFPMTLLTLASLGSSSAVFLAGAGAGRSLWLLFTCGALVAAFLCASVVRAVTFKNAPYELLTLIVPQ